MRFAQPGWLWLLVLLPLPWLLERTRPRISWPNLAAFPGRASHRLVLVTRVAGHLARAGDRLSGRGAGSAADRRRHDPDRRPGGRDRRRTRQQLEHERGRFPHGPRHPADFAARSRQDDVHALRRRAFRRPDRPGRLRQLSRAGMSARSSTTRFCWKRSPRCDRRGRETMARTSATRSRGARCTSGRLPKKKVLVLLTDGNNEPAVPDPLDPEQAAILARDLGVTMHTIAIGRTGGRHAGHRSGRQGCPLLPKVDGAQSAAPRAIGPAHRRALVRRDRRRRA